MIKKKRIITDKFSVLVSEIKSWRIADASYEKIQDKHYETRLIVRHGDTGHDVIEGLEAAEFYQQLCDCGWANPGANIFKAAGNQVNKLFETADK